jgi:hypothetical protein
MSGFQVRPAALETFANTLCSTGSGGSDAGSAGLDYEFVISAQNYTDEWVKLEGGSGGLIYRPIVGVMDSLRAQLDGNYSQIGELLIASANGLTASAARYRTQDHATAARLDSLYRPAGVRPMPGTVDVSATKVDPATVLTEPGDGGAVPDMVQQILDGVGYFSESEIVLKILSLCGLDVEDLVKESFAVDYRALARCRNAIGNLAEFDDAAATLIADDTATMMKSWQGTAATAAQNYFDQFAGDVSAHANKLSALAHKLDALVIGIQQAGSTFVGVLTLVLDRAAEVAASTAAAGCLEEVPVADAILDGVDAWKITELIKKIHELADVWAKVWTGLQGMMAAIVSLVGAFQDYSASVRLPAAGYQAVAR